jgi:sec-independent protein translocase protein TatA
MTHSLNETLGVLGPLGWPEIVIILFVVMLLFGAKRLPDLAKSFGKSIKEFKKATTAVEEDLRSGVEGEPAETTNGVGKSSASPGKAEQK